MRANSILTTAALLSGNCEALAQEIEWINPAGGSWNVADNWQSGEIPDSFFELARIETSGSYSVEFDRSTLLSGMRLLNPNVVVNMHAGSSMYLAVASAAALTIDGLLNVNPERENRGTEISTCGDQYNSVDVLADGAGTIRLNAHPDNLDSARIGGFCSSVAMRIGANQTIAGTGRINLNLYCDGTIVADVPGGVLELSGTGYPDVNVSGEVRAEGGGRLRVSGGFNTYWESVGGRVIVADAQSAVEWLAASVRSTIIDNTAGGTSEFRGYSQLNRATLLGPHVVFGGSTLSTYSGFTNNGVLTIRSGSAGPAALQLGDNSNATIGGSGTILLNGTADLPTLARISPPNFESELRLGEQQSLAGTGQVGVDVVNSGELSPGVTNSPIGLIELQSTDWTQTGGARMVVDVAGINAGDFDRLTRADRLTLAGSLVVRLVGAFEPDVGDEFVICTHLYRSGAFSTITAPPLAEKSWHVRYDPNETVLFVSCGSDLNGDGQTTLADLATLLAHFGTSGPGLPGDINADGVVSLQDLALLLQAFGAACG